MRTLLEMVEDLITEGRTDKQIWAVAVGMGKDAKETRAILKKVRKRLRKHTRTRR